MTDPGLSDGAPVTPPGPPGAATAPPPPPPDPTSILGHLGARRAQIAAEQVLVLPVPRWHDPDLFVKFGLMTRDDLNRASKSINKAKNVQRDSAEWYANIDMLIKCCLGVFARLEGDDTEYSLRPGDPHGELTMFDPDLAANLGLSDGASARAVVQELYVADGDIVGTFLKLAEWSGFTNDKIEEDVQGE